jgi:hypothetical protein
MFEKEDPTRQGSTAGVAEVDHPGGSIASPDKARIPAGQSSGHEGRAGNARSCAYCGRPLRPKRGSRRQQYCSDAHRQAALRTKKWKAKFGGLDLSRSPKNRCPDQDQGLSRSVEISCLVSTICKGTFGDRAYSINGPPEAIQTEIIADRYWRPVTSGSSVTCQVTRIGPANRPITAVVSRWEPTWSPHWRDQVDLPIPEFLHRAIPTTAASPTEEAV